MGGEKMREFWDARATENPRFYIDNTLNYFEPSDEQFWAHGESELDNLLDAVGARLEPNDDVVEIGCGIGRMTQAIARRAATVRALDISSAMLDQAREKGRSLSTVEWILGDGVSLAGIDDESADVCLSHVVFQHIPDPQITLGYIREIGRILRPGAWAAFQISNDPNIHRRRTGREGLTIMLRAIVGRGPRGQADPAWLGSHVEIDDLRAAADESEMSVTALSGEGKQLCFVRTERRS